MRWYEAVPLGALGGICPTLAKLGGSYSADPTLPPPQAGVYIALLIFAMLGSIIALAFGRDNLRAAIAAGIAAPAIVTNILSGFKEVQENRTAPLPPEAGIHLFVSPAYAQTQPLYKTVPVQMTREVITIVPDLTGGAPSKSALTYAWDKDGQTIPGATGYLSVLDEQTLKVPEGATALKIGQKSIPMSTIAEMGNTLDLMIHTSPTLRGDLIWALGGNRTFTIENLELKADR